MRWAGRVGLPQRIEQIGEVQREAARQGVEPAARRALGRDEDDGHAGLAALEAQQAQRARAARRRVGGAEHDVHARREARGVLRLEPLDLPAKPGEPVHGRADLLREGAAVVRERDSDEEARNTLGPRRGVDLRLIVVLVGRLLVGRFVALPAEQQVVEADHRAVGFSRSLRVAFGAAAAKVSRNGPRKRRLGDQSVIANTTSENAPRNSCSSACRKSAAVR